MKMIRKHALFVLILASTMMMASAQDSTGYHFTTVKTLKATPVKNQYKSGTCWSFSAISFLESELIRKGAGEYNLSEMFVVRNAYEKKADKYVRMHGSISFSGGGALNDVLDVWKNEGIVPDEAYPGLNYGTTMHEHGELDDVLKAYVDVLVKKDKLTTAWKNGFDGILDAYLGKYPSSFTYKGKEYTPKSFAASLDINPDDYVLISSYSNHPFYTKFVIEVPDNWSWGEAWNVPIDEMGEIIDNSVKNGYTVAWAADVSDRGFSWKNGVAIVPAAQQADDLSGTEREKWDKLSAREKLAQLYNFNSPVQQKVITQELRQEAFNDYETTDDHGMHITGLANDQLGQEYYLVKNSWGTTGSPYNGYLYASKAYVLYKTTSIMVNKNAIPKDIAKKLGITK